MFYNCYSVITIIIPDSVTSIGSSAFNGCSGLTSINLPESLESIGDEAFANCTSLQEVYCYATTPPSCGDGAFENSLSDASSSNAATRATSSETDYTTTLYVPSGTLELYQAASVWQDFPSIVEMGSDTAIDYISAGESVTTPISYITLSGQQVSEPAKGTVNIVRMSDGTTRKVLVK